MCIELKQIENYSDEIFYFIKDNPKSFEGTEFLQDKQDELKGICLFDIIKENLSVGFIMLVDISDEYTPYYYELEIGIFNKYRKSGYAIDSIEAIKKMLRGKHMEEIKLRAVVKNENPKKKAMQHILTKCGFYDMDMIEKAAGAVFEENDNINKEYIITIKK